MSVSSADHHQTFKKSNHINSSVSEIREEFTDETYTHNECDTRPLPSIREDYFEIISDVTSLNGDDIVYVGVGKSDSSMDPLSWTLRHAVNPSSTLVCLIHVFPETRYIPYPLGRLLKSQASPEQVESYMAQERGKRRELLHKFIAACSAANVKVDTMLIESDLVAKAIQDLIPILNMRKLVLGISKSNARKLRFKRGNGIAEQILNSCAADKCDVKVICEGKEMMIEWTMEPQSTHCSEVSSKSPKEQQQSSDNPRKKDQSIDPFACICFNKPKTIS